jgi:hypothetical protein
MGGLAELFWGMIFSAFGLAYFIYGKRQMTVTPLVCGLVLMVFPYMAPNLWVLFLVSLVLIVLPFVFPRR